ncbi:MAG: radical SAM protein [Planctomycetes bacterium]|nr:radical SAM protein [Planctomycetota bacterium]
MAKDKFRIDSHKLIFHPRRVADYLEGKNVYPIYMEISPVGSCNHRCIFCSVDFIGYQSRRLETGVLLDRLDELGRLGLKSVMYAGEGEPFLHKDMALIAQRSKAAGIDVAFTTNGVLMKPEIAEKVLPVTEWIKVSCNAGTPEAYEKIHGTKAEDFETVIENFKVANELRKKNNWSCTLGFQIVMLPMNVDNVVPLAERAREIGMDYLVVKPYMPHRDNAHHFEINYESLESVEKELERLNSDSFSVIYRAKAMQKWDRQEKTYDKCLALPFWSYIDAGGKVWGCSVYLEDENFLYGDIYEQTFEEIWEGEKRRKSLEYVKENLDISNCKYCCRMDEINRYLWDLKIPPEHVNFI